MLSALYSRRVLVAVQCSAFQPAALAYRCVPFAGVWCGESCELCAARAVARLLYECATRDSLDRRPRLELAACKALAPSWLPNIRVLCLAGAPICKTNRRSSISPSAARCAVACPGSSKRTDTTVSDWPRSYPIGAAAPILPLTPPILPLIQG